ncbi:MAG: Na-translocating system protein MpsC family protein [Pirellulaceae bacterium]
MNTARTSMARQVAEAAHTFELRRTGRVPTSVTVLMAERTLVISVHGALSEAEKAVARIPTGAAQVQEFHRQLFAHSCGWLTQEIKRITNVDVQEAMAEVETTGTVVQTFSDGTIVQVFLLAAPLPAESWSTETLTT